MKKLIHFFTKKVLLFGFLLLSFTSNAQHFTITLANLTATTNTFEVDIILIVDAPSQGIRLSAVATNIHFNPAILNGGWPCQYPSCGSWQYIPGTQSTAILALWPTTKTYTMQLSTLKTTQTQLLEPASIHILPGTYIIGRYRFTNTGPWAANTDVQLYLLGNQTAVTFYPYGATTPLTGYTVNNPVGGTGLTLGYTENAPLSRILNAPLATTENSVNPLQVSPNPFSAAFNLSFETISNEPITVKVYDMIGKLIENRSVEANAINTMQLGGNYQAGIYNVSVSQGEKVQNIRVIKK